MLSGESEMQDPSGAAPVRPMSPGCSRILGNRRLRPHRPNQPLKCPRCESVNTKFCYYNNYNLSQPRHFCKSYRRYWTEGGVLRNVPVGGGCRKAKRAKSRSSHNKREKRDSGRASPRSSSESSSLTATDPFSASDDVHTIPANPPLAVSSLPAVAVMDQITFPPESRLFSNPYPSPSVLEPSVLSAGLSSDAIFSDSDTFTSLLTGKIASSLHGSGLGYTASEFPFKFHHQKTDEMAQDANEMTVGFTDKLPSVNDMASLYESADNPGLTQFDWQTHTDPPPALFDLPNAVDSDYWGQNQWEDHDHHPLYLP